MNKNNQDNVPIIVNVMQVPNENIPNRKRLVMNPHGRLQWNA